MAVEGYTGLFGSGKTYAAVMKVYNRRRKNPHAPVMTNLTRLDLPGDPVEYLWAYEDPDEMLEAMARFNTCTCDSPAQHEAGIVQHVEETKVERWWWPWARTQRDVSEYNPACSMRAGAVMVLDEVGVFLPARIWNRMPPALSWKWNQLRKDSIDLIWTCIRPANVVKDLRDITMETHWCDSWKAFGFFSQATYSYTSVGDKKYFQSRAYRRFRPSLATELYDTMGKVRAPKFLQKKEKASIPELSSSV